MVFNPVTDFLGIWRATGGNVVKGEMPALDCIVAALARAGVITLSVSATAPVANQSITAWLQAAVPSYSAEGALFLWDKVTTAYLAATPKLFAQFLEATAGENGTSWWTSTGGAPPNTVGNNGDFAIRTDTPNGIYGPKAAGAWPASPVPGTADVMSSATLDNTFGSVVGDLIYRDVTVWQALTIGAPSSVLVSLAGIPAWETLSALMDAVFGSVQGSILYRDAALWNDLSPGVANQVLASGGPAANPAWASRTAEFPSGTVMLFQQTAAPTGWTKQTALNDYGLRVTSGAVGSTAGSPFSTVFAQTAVGNHTLVVGEIPSHTHAYTLTGTGAPLNINSGGATGLTFTATNTGSAGGDGAHSHSVNLTMSYTDVIIASKA
jgi:hypothetical protein